MRLEGTLREPEVTFVAPFWALVWHCLPVLLAVKGGKGVRGVKAAAMVILSAKGQKSHEDSSPELCGQDCGVKIDRSLELSTGQDRMDT